LPEMGKSAENHNQDVAGKTKKNKKTGPASKDRKAGGNQSGHSLHQTSVCVNAVLRMTAIPCAQRNLRKGSKLSAEEKRKQKAITKRKPKRRMGVTPHLLIKKGETKTAHSRRCGRGGQERGMFRGQPARH